MAGEKISALIPEATSLADDDRMLVSVDLGGGSWESRFISGASLNNNYFANMANTNLVATIADRYYEVAGSTSTDKWGVRVPLAIANSFEVRGDDSVYVPTRMGVGVTPNTTYAFRAQENTSGSGAANFVSNRANTVVSSNSQSNGVCINASNSGTGLPTVYKATITVNGALKKGFEALISGTGTNIGYEVNVQGGSNNYGIQFSNGDIKFTTTGTGTKIGVTTSDKFSFWGATPTIQPTTGILAGTFVANTSGIADDSATFGGYTIGQIAAALRTVGILA